MPIQVIYICAAMLIVGAAPLPYGYYMLLRLIACGTFAAAAYVAFNRKGKVLPYVFGLLAILFNPILKIHLPKEIWAVADLAAGILLLASAKHIKVRS